MILLFGVPGNTTALITSEGVVLVDDKFPQDADNISWFPPKLHGRTWSTASSPASLT